MRGGPGSRACHRLLLIGRCSQCPGHSLWEEAGRRGRPSLAAGLQRAQGPKLDSALWKASPDLESERKGLENKSHWVDSEGQTISIINMFLKLHQGKPLLQKSNLQINKERSCHLLFAFFHACKHSQGTIRKHPTNIKTLSQHYMNNGHNYKHMQLDPEVWKHLKLLQLCHPMRWCNVFLILNDSSDTALISGWTFEQQVAAFGQTRWAASSESGWKMLSVVNHETTTVEKMVLKNTQFTAKSLNVDVRYKLTVHCEHIHHLQLGHQ